MNDTDIYADAYRAPDPPPDAAADTGSTPADIRGALGRQDVQQDTQP